MMDRLIIYNYKYLNLTQKLLSSLCIQIFSSIFMVFKANQKHISKATGKYVSKLA